MIKAKISSPLSHSHPLLYIYISSLQPHPRDFRPFPHTPDFPRGDERHGWAPHDHLEPARWDYEQGECADEWCSVSGFLGARWPVEMGSSPARIGREQGWWVEEGAPVGNCAALSTDQSVSA